MTPLRLVERKPSGGDLGPNQLRWLKENVPSFSAAWRAVKKSDEHAERIKSKLMEGAGT
jgi:hypothetical protein